MSPESAILVLERHTEEVAMEPVSLERQVLIKALCVAVRMLKEYTKDWDVSDVVDLLRDSGVSVEMVKEGSEQ